MSASYFAKTASVAAVLVSAISFSNALGAEVAYYLAALPAVPESLESESGENIILTNCCTDSKCDCGSPCTDGCGCSNCCGPQYYAMGEYVAYNRNNGSVQRPILENIGGTPLLFTDDLNFDYASGVRVRLGKKNGPCSHFNAWEIEYLGIFNWNTAAQVVNTGDIYLPGDLGFSVNGFQGADVADVSYASQLHSVELNGVKCHYQTRCCSRSRRLDFLYGFRYLRLKEDLTISSNNLAAVDAIYNLDAKNDLYGFQLGARWTSWSAKRIGLEIVCKGGIYGNDAQQTQSVVDNIGATPFNLRPLTGASKGSVAFVGELSVIPKYRLTDVWTLRGGYNLLWIEGVALAPDQLDFTDTGTSGTSINTNGGVFAHGVSAGLEARF